MCKRNLARKKMLLVAVLLTNLLLATEIPGLLGSLPQESSVSRCSLFGNDHIKTFDGSFYDFAGDCSYLIAGDCHKHSFTLLGDYQDGKKIGFSVYIGEYFSLHFSLDGSVMQEDKRISIPFASNGIFIEREAGYYKISSDEHGFVVKTDISGNIQIFLQEKHYNKTCGLCGNFNNFAEDDFRTQEGALVGNRYDFANSWALHSENKRCKRLQTPSNTCNISSDMAEKGALETCQLLRTSLTFSRCHHRVDPEPYIHVCERDICACAQPMGCHCSVFLDYARSCAHQGVLVDGWPEESSCRPRCPVGMEYKECVAPCAKTCQSLNINEVCDGQCVDGCSCPEGKLLDGEHCIASSDCSCIHSGKHYPPGFTISQDCNSCICRRGTWICSNGECPGECSVTGQSHFKSFDNRYFTFSGICHYLFAKDCVENSFSVVIETVQCADDPDAVCTRSVSVRIQGLDNSLIRMKHGGGISLNGQDVQIPLLQGALRIQRMLGTAARLAYGEDLQVDWDGHGQLLVKLSPVYSERTCGLCGNYNGNQGDDFLTPSGMVEARLEDFGNSWKLKADCQNLLKQDSDPCSLNPRLARYAEESCSVLMSAAFEPCHHEVSPTPYVKNCRFDVCSCSSGGDCLCSAVASYAAACARRGVLVQWREPDFCPMPCPADRVYQQCGTPCNQTCRSLSHPEEDCAQLCLEGCYCPPGHYLDERERCVPKALCSCYYEGEIFQPEDVFSDHYSMCYCENGFMHCTTSRVPGAFLTDVFADERPSARIKRSLTCRPPMERFVCPANNPRAEGLECAKTCQNYDLECVSHGCVSGCLCPPGMVRHESKCVAPARCPCFHHGREYARGETVTSDCNTCVCQGRKWECTKNACDGTCTVIGTAHYLTFDGLKYRFPGSCQYVLAQDFCKDDSGTFRILISNEGCGFTGEKCTKRVVILYESMEVELFNGNVNVRVPPKDDSDLEILKSGRYYIILVGKSISVTWDLSMGVSVILKGNFKDQVCGLCGNFDGIQNNDLTSSNEHLEVDPVDFGNSWKVNPYCADVEKPNWEQSTMSPLCNGNILKQVMVETSCSILSGDLFEECRKLVNPEPYIDICMYETCACESVGDCACFCETVSAYAHACAQRGAAAPWRSPALCPQSCQDLNKEELDYQCDWRYNSCGPACPITCQHPEPLECPLRCVEGCHVHCPAGKILDELSLDCVSPEDCPVCAVGDARIPHGKAVVLNREDPQHCQSCVCEGKNLTCVACEPVEENLLLTTPVPEEDIELPASEYSCSKMMDLAFLMDGSNKLSEEDFEQLKAFIIGMMKKLHISQKKIRVSVLVYRAGPTIYLGLKDIKTQSQMRRIVQGIKYSGDEAASAPEALKYSVFHVFGKAERSNAARIAVLFMASRSAGKLRNILAVLRAKGIAVVAVGIGPHISLEQVRFIEKQSQENKAFLMSNVLELMDNRDLLIDHLCDLGPEESSLLQTTAPPTASGIFSPPWGLTAPPPLSEMPTRRRLDVAFIVEGSDSVGEENFHAVKEFLERVITGMNVGQEDIHITVMQYAETVTLEYSFRETQSKETIIEKVRSIPYQGGKATNTGNALDYISKHTFTAVNGGRQDVPHLVYMVSSSPSTDVITRPPSSINVIPIGITPNADVQELRRISHPNNPIILHSYRMLIEEAPELVLQSCCSHKLGTEIPELCSKPMDVIFLLDGSSNVGASEFEEMKNFVQAFIERAEISNSSMHVSVLQYSRDNTLEISWNMPQETEYLVRMVQSIQQREQGPARLGKAIDFVVQNVMSESHGGRASASKVAIVVVSGRSEDPLEAAALSARMNRVSLFPIGVGSSYDEEQLRTLAGASAANRIMKLLNFEDLSTMITLNSEFIKKVCMDPARECIDEDGNRKKPGDKWTLPDQCHTVTCFPGDYTVLESHQLNCERMPKPLCHSNLPAVKVEETCGCRWMCPCVCIGSSSRHIVTFDGLNFRLTGNCSYTLFQDPPHDVEVLLHEGPCRATPKMNCMDSIEVKHGDVSVQLFSDMAVAVNGEKVHIPYSSSLFEVTVYGAIMHEIKFSHLGHNLTFTPRNNEFILKLNSKSFSSGTQGLCGVCDQNHVNDFTLRDGSVTADSSTFIHNWTLEEPGRACESRREDRCSEHPTRHCHLLLSSQFAACHSLISPSMFFEACMESSCYEDEACEMITSYAHVCRENGACVAWRTPEICPMSCPPPLTYDPCHTACTKHCENGTELSVCQDYPAEGCFCPHGQVSGNGSCAHAGACSQCLGEDGTLHQHMESWIPASEPCKICTCLAKEVNCTVRPCPAAKPVQCGPCEVPRLRRDPGQCCPEYECVCDLVSCDLPPAPVCEFGMQLALTNPGECRPNYTCVCDTAACSSLQTPSCPPHRQPRRHSTACCDTYECACACTNSTLTCPPGYLSRTLANDCNCLSTTCTPDRVCVHKNIVYPPGTTWEDGCKDCFCTNMKDDITGLQMVECHDKVCNTFCSRGYQYIAQEGECCGRCQKTACEEQLFWSRGDGDARLHEVGTEWRSPFDPCVVNECVRVNDEVFVQQKNLSCSHMDVPDCPQGTELRCGQVIDCCPSCRCVPLNGCLLNGTVIGPWRRLMVDQCTTCLCSAQPASAGRYTLACTKLTCEPCPANYRRQEILGSCCGKCVPTSCGIRLRDGRVRYLQPNESLQDGCDNHSCKVNEKGEFIWERRITGCPPFDARRCLAEGGRITKIGNTCCETCVEVECRPVSTRLQYKNINGCVAEREVPISHCEGKCRSSTRYSAETGGWEDLCSCCTATQSTTVTLPLRCANGTVVQHYLPSASQCQCRSRPCAGASLPTRPPA